MPVPSLALTKCHGVRLLRTFRRSNRHGRRFPGKAWGPITQRWVAQRPNNSRRLGRRPPVIGMRPSGLAQPSHLSPLGTQPDGIERSGTMRRRWITIAALGAGALLAFGTISDVAWA